MNQVVKVGEVQAIPEVSLFRNPMVSNTSGTDGRFLLGDVAEWCMTAQAHGYSENEPVWFNHSDAKVVSKMFFKDGNDNSKHLTTSRTDLYTLQDMERARVAGRTNGFVLASVLAGIFIFILLTGGLL